MYTTTKISADLHRVIMLRSFHDRAKRRQTASQSEERAEAVYGSKSYRDALQRAFTKAKEQIYFNPDMTNFITLTYKGKDHTPDQVLHDVKMLVKKESRLRDSNPDGQSGVKRAKYIYIMEYQKRGSIHVHMIANDFFTLQVNKNGYNELKHWQKGFSSVLRINDFDNNFRPYLYLFKYMKKSQRIGKSFVHSSRNLTNYTTLEDASIDLEFWNTINMERTETTVETTKFTYYKNYLEFDDTMTLQQLNQEDITTWHEQVKLHSNKELEKILANHSRR